MKDTVALFKKRLQVRGYGKYDLLEDLFSEHDLLHKKPRVIFFHVSQLLNNDVNLNLKSFYTWLSRYRKKNTVKSTITPEKVWENFKPTQLLEAVTKPDPIVLEIIKPKKI